VIHWGQSGVHVVGVKKEKVAYYKGGTQSIFQPWSGRDVRSNTIPFLIGGKRRGCQKGCIKVGGVRIFVGNLVKIALNQISRRGGPSYILGGVM